MPLSLGTIRVPLELPTALWHAASSDHNYPFGEVLMKAICWKSFAFSLPITLGPQLEVWSKNYIRKKSKIQYLRKVDKISDQKEKQ